ncbi:MAG TPA: adenylate/guanylate cyclase domain-containing protein, partial [Candidatus Limnocylindria bacterium]|nr:adenylate/guanylate cyclase domain-containing protein [Candidatus Limnocylindria bacterium]
VTTRRFATVVFTDIVDSTRQSSAMGDAGWHALIDQHDRLARKIVDQHGGRVVKSTGDGLLAIFDVPSEGVACGVAMCRELRNLGVEIRAGVHAGEIEIRDDFDISGIAVNLAARVEQAAADGELWASSTVRDMMLGGAASFSDRGEHTLKGIDGNWRLFAVESSGG